MISLIIPALNEADGIAATIQVAQAVFAEAGWSDCEVVVVDDGSDDGTGAIAASLGARVVRHPVRAGYGRSLKDGITAARHDLVAIADADGTYPLDQLPRMVAEMDKGFDMVVGARTGKQYRESVIKAPLRMVLKFLVEFTAGRKIEDINSGLRVFRRSGIMPYFSHLCDTFSFTTSMTLAYLMTGKFITHLPIPYHQRIGKTKVRLFRDALVTMQYIVQAILYYNPIKLFIVMCGLIWAVSALGLSLSGIFGITAGYYVCVGGFLVSIVVFAIGLLADLLRQIMAK